jgi:hypothetical protein
VWTNYRGSKKGKNATKKRKIEGEVIEISDDGPSPKPVCLNIYYSVWTNYRGSKKGEKTTEKQRVEGEVIEISDDDPSPKPVRSNNLLFCVDNHTIP